MKADRILVFSLRHSALYSCWGRVWDDCLPLYPHRNQLDFVDWFIEKCKRVGVVPQLEVDLPLYRFWFPLTKKQEETLRTELLQENPKKRKRDTDFSRHDINTALRLYTRRSDLFINSADQIFDILDAHTDARSSRLVYILSETLKSYALPSTTATQDQIIQIKHATGINKAEFANVYTNDTRGNYILDRVRSFHSERCPSEEYIQDVIGIFAGPMNGVPPLLHNLRHSDVGDVSLPQDKDFTCLGNVLRYVAAHMKRSFHFQNCQYKLLWFLYLSVFSLNKKTYALPKLDHDAEEYVVNAWSSSVAHGLAGYNMLLKGTVTIDEKGYSIPVFRQHEVCDLSTLLSITRNTPPPTSIRDLTMIQGRFWEYESTGGIPEPDLRILDVFNLVYSTYNLPPIHPTVMEEIKRAATCLMVLELTTQWGNRTHSLDEVTFYRENSVLKMEHIVAAVEMNDPSRRKGVLELRDLIKTDDLDNPVLSPCRRYFLLHPEARKYKHHQGVTQKRIWNKKEWLLCVELALSVFGNTEREVLSYLKSKVEDSKLSWCENFLIFPTCVRNYLEEKYGPTLFMLSLRPTLWQAKDTVCVSEISNATGAVRMKSDTKMKVKRTLSNQLGVHKSLFKSELKDCYARCLSIASSRYGDKKVVINIGDRGTVVETVSSEKGPFSVEVEGHRFTNDSQLEDHYLEERRHSVKNKTIDDHP